jgi:hypothetical protein
MPVEAGKRFEYRSHDRVGLADHPLRLTVIDALKDRNPSTNHHSTLLSSSDKTTEPM